MTARGAFFYHHDRTILWFAPVPLGLAAYIAYLVRNVRRPSRTTASTS